jgi:putative ABC transport system permease protein
METVVGSIREVDWGRMQLNFSVVFPTGVLENAPQFHVLTTNAPDKAASANLQRQLVKQYPNVSILDLRQVISLVEGILDKISWVISFMAFFSILTGIIVLIGSVRNSKYQRIRENVLLRTLGAKSKQILRITALEYLYLGVLGSGIGILLSLISSQLLALFIFETPFVPSLIPFVVVFPGITLLVLLIGLSNSRQVLNSPPLQVLRKETA